MVGIPFGASYFPTELPMIGKEVLGLRMFLFSTMVAQFVFTFKSKFENGIGLQMVRNERLDIFKASHKCITFSISPYTFSNTR